MLAFEHLTVETRPPRTKRNAKAKQLLNCVSGNINGGLWAIMGASGSGKTTLLSALSLRLDTYRMSQYGVLRLNGREYTKSILKACSSFVAQDDLVNASLSVFETLTYAAELRMAAACTPQERAEMVEHVMELVGIQHCRDTLVGDTRFKGISGGERKRLCVAVELLTKPRILFLDEPTSGLDSSTALMLVKLLKGLSAAPKFPTTVVTTLHQPQFKIFSLFDSLILMKKGDIVYQGPAGTDVVSFFASLGFPCPAYNNPADHILDVLTGSEMLDEAAGPPQPEGLAQAVSTDDLLKAEMVAIEAADTRQVYSLSLSSSSAPALPPFPVVVDRDAGIDQPEFAPHSFLPWSHQFAVLLRRSLHLHVRRWDIILMNVFVTMLVSTFVSMSTWRALGTSNSSTSRRLPALFYCTIHQGTHSFPLDRALMLRERSAGSYTVSAYFAAKSAADFIVQLISPVIFSSMVYPIVGFDAGATKFFVFMGFMILTSQAATSLSNLVSCLCVSIELSTVVLACCYEISRLYGGWFIKPADMVMYPEWRFADALSYIKYSFVGISLNEDAGLVITCTAPAKTCAAPCTVGAPCVGNTINSFYGYSDYTIGYCAGILVVYIVVAKLFSYLALRYIKM